MDTLRKCDYNSTSNLLCRVVGFNVSNTEMLELDARILTQPEIISAPNYPARINNGRILLDGQLYRPIPISSLAITYFGPNFAQYKPAVDQFTDKLIEVSSLSITSVIQFFVLGYAIL
jgi:hypothetical protein